MHADSILCAGLVSPFCLRPPSRHQTAPTCSSFWSFSETSMRSLDGPCAKAFLGGSCFSFRIDEHSRQVRFV
jgi:hypothetical protein